MVIQPGDTFKDSTNEKLENRIVIDMMDYGKPGVVDVDPFC